MNVAELFARLEALDKAATPASEVKVAHYDLGGGLAFSRIGGESRSLIADFYSEADGECYLAARNELPRLLRLLRAGEKATTALEATFGSHHRCAACGRTPEGIGGIAHEPDCLVGAALREWHEAAR